MKWITKIGTDGMEHELSFRLGPSSHSLKVVRVEGIWSITLDGHLVCRVPENIKGHRDRRAFAFDALRLRAKHYDALLDRLDNEEKDLRK